MLLKQKTAVITGCNRGIGKATLETFAENGADIFACVRKESDEFTDVMTKLTAKTGISITPVYFDFTESEQVKSGIKTIISFKKQIDILVNNAGVASGSLFQMTSLQDLKDLFEINFFSQLYFTQGISRYMSRFKTGSIINIGSTAGFIGSAGMTSYGSSKAALMFSTKTMATELGVMYIRMNASASIITKTDMSDHVEGKFVTNF